MIVYLDNFSIVCYFAFTVICFEFFSESCSSIWIHLLPTEKLNKDTKCPGYFQSLRAQKVKALLQKEKLAMSFANAIGLN